MRSVKSSATSSNKGVSSTGRDLISSRVRLARLVFLAPGLIYIAIFMIIPLGILISYTFFTRGTYGGVDFIFTLENYTRALDWLYLSVLFESILIAAITTLLAFLIGFPVAYAVTKLPSNWQNIMLVLIVLPFGVIF